MASITAKDIEKNICRDLTDKFLTALDKGEIPWEKPWVCSESGYIGSSGKPYGVLNSILCAMNGHEAGEFVTYNELKARGGSFIPKADGSKQEPTIIVYRGKSAYRRKDADGNYIPLKDENGKPMYKNGKPLYEMSSRWVLSTAKVWRVGTQVDCKTKYLQKYEKKEHNKIDHAEKIIIDYVAREGVKMIHAIQNRAYYQPSTDTVNVPPMETFSTVEGYYDTTFHELAHSTGAENRLKRDIKNVFGDHKYSKEELVAEITATMIMHDNGWNTPKTDRNADAYIQSWGKALRSDPMLIEKAMSAADKAVKRIYGKE